MIAAWSVQISRLERNSRALAPAAAEFLIFLLGVLLRLALSRTYDPRAGFDAVEHIRYFDYIARHDALPELTFSRVAYHPPLWYVLASVVWNSGGTLWDVQLISIYAGILTLVCVWIGLRLYFPNDRFARLMGLGLAAVLPCAIHTQGMLSNEALCILLSTAIFLFIRPAFEASGLRRAGACLGLSLSLSAALLAKASPLIFFGAFALSVGLDLVWRREEGAEAALRRHFPLASALALAMTLALPVHFRHYANTGLLFPTGYDAMGYSEQDPAPLWKRRALGFYFAPCLSVIENPYFPECSGVRARFWSVLVATTFGDYFNYNYAGPPRAGEPSMELNHRTTALTTVALTRAPVAAGMLIAITTAVSTLIGLWGAVRRRDATLVTLCLVPILAVLGQLYFSVRFPDDNWGPIKGNYLLFASAPMFALYGAACSWLWRHPRWRLIGVLQVCGVLAVGAYSIYARWHALPQ